MAGKDVNNPARLLDLQGGAEAAARGKLSKTQKPLTAKQSDAIRKGTPTGRYAAKWDN